MSLRLYRVTLGADGVTRTVTVPSSTDVQAGDAAAGLASPGEVILSIEETDDADAVAEGPPPLSQAAELAPVTPGAAAAPAPGSDE